MASSSSTTTADGETISNSTLSVSIYLKVSFAVDSSIGFDDKFKDLHSPLCKS